MCSPKSIAQELLANDPASKMLGIEIREILPQAITLQMQVTEQMTNGYDVCHGGLVYTLADTALAFVAASSGETVLSASSQIEYLNPARVGDDLIAQAQLEESSGRQVFAKVTVSVAKGSNKKLIAMIHGRLVRKRN